MAVNYTNLFNGIGEHIQRVNDFRGYYSDLDTDLSQIATDMNSIGRLDVHSGTEELFLGYKAALLGWIQGMRGKIDLLLTHRTTILEELAVGSSADVQTVLFNLIRDMNDNTVTVNRSTVTLGSVTTDCQNSSIGTVLTGKVMDRVSAPVSGGRANPEYKGVDCELAVASETMVFTCTQDGETGASSGGELWSWLGEPTSRDPFSYENRGSGTGPSLRTLNAETYLSNLDFEDFTASAPDDWTIATGAAGSTIDDETGASNIYGGSTGLKLLGNASIASIEITQALPVSRLLPGKRYCFAIWVKGNASISAGTLTIILKGTGYTAGSTEKIEMNQAALAAQTSFDIEYFFVTMPDVIPDDLYLSIALAGTPSAHAIYLDTGAFGPVVYHGGVHACIVAGKNAFLKNDRLRVTNTNNESGVVQTYFGKAYKVQLPSSGSSSINDNVAT
jgi:hypothetical protein